MSIMERYGMPSAAAHDARVHLAADLGPMKALTSPKKPQKILERMVSVWRKHTFLDSRLICINTMTMKVLTSSCSLSSETDRNG